MSETLRIFEASAPAQSLHIVAGGVDLYLAEKTLERDVGKFAAASFDKVARYLTIFKVDYGQETVASRRKSDFLRWLAKHPEWASPYSQSDAVGSVVTCFRWLEDQGHIDRNPYYSRPRGLIDVLEPRMAITPEEYLIMLRAAKRRGRKKSRVAFRMAIFFLWQTGCRTCEVREMRWQDVDWRAGSVRLKKGKTSRKTGTRIIALTRAALRLLGFLKRWRNPTPADFIFTSGRGKQLDKATFARYFRKVADFAGVRSDVSAYTLRHGFTVCGLENGAHDRQLADLLGQASTRYIAWYGKQAKSKLDYLRKTLDQVHGKGGPGDG